MSLAIMKHRRKWRVAALLLFVVALLAPWSFDRISVPGEYACGAGYVRLEGDLCGLPYPGALVLVANAIQLIPLAVTLLGGGTVAGEWEVRVGFGVAMLLLLLPLFTTVSVLRRGSRGRRQAVHVVAWGLGAIAGVQVLALLSRAFGLGVYLWGVWVYVALALVMIGLELWVAAARRVSSRIP